MNLLHTIRRRLMINRTLRELSHLDQNLLNDIGLDRSNLTETVQKMVDAQYVYQHQETPKPAFHTAPAAHGAAA